MKILTFSKLCMVVVLSSYNNLFAQNPISHFGESHYCNKDILCPEGSGYSLQRDAVGLLYGANNQPVGSAFLIQPAVNAPSGYLMTASHVSIVPQSGAYVRFLYYSSSCGGGDNLEVRTITLHPDWADIVAQSTDGDLTLYKLRSPL
jgi:hypothetical protein